MARSTANALPGDFKKEIATLSQQVAKKKKELGKLNALFKQTRKQLSKAYHSLMGLVDQFGNLKVYGTKKAEALKQRIKDGQAENVRLTEIRDGYLADIETANTDLITLGTRLAILCEQEANEIKTMDDIVTQVFALNEAVVQAATAREECLKRYVFPRLVDSRGKLLSQITFDSSDGRRRVIAMVNTMTLIKGDLAAEAKREIEDFFERVQKRVEVDPNIEALLNLTRQLLVEKTDFKVGPDLYRFLSMDIDAKIFPELARAQLLLRQSIRSEKTNSYIRIKERLSREDNWKDVRQS